MRDNRPPWHMIYAHGGAKAVTVVIDRPAPRATGSARILDGVPACCQPALCHRRQPRPEYEAIADDGHRLHRPESTGFAGQIGVSGPAPCKRAKGGDTTGNGVSKLIFTILSAVAEAERDRTRERIAEVKRDQRQRGRYLGGTPPFGWRVGEAGELVPVPEQQAAIKRTRRLKDQGLALRAIADRMTAAGIQISHVGVKKALAAAA